MRYTTIIDISEISPVYRNINARLVYLHLVLKSGYHDDDRDLVIKSLRRIAAETGLSLSAVRHAVAMLEKAHLLSRQGPFWLVKKWIIEQKITTRARTARQQKQIEIEAERRIENEKREREAAIAKARREQLEAQGKTPFMAFYEGLQKKAAAGDLEAAESMKRWASTYDKAKQAMSHVSSGN
jgi:DNA-binding transcriptional MerR regulator